MDKDDNIYVSDDIISSLFKFINNQLYVCDCGNYRVQILNTELEYVNSFGCHGGGDGQFRDPNDIVQDRAGNWYVSDSKNHRVQVFDCKRQFLSTFSNKSTVSEQLRNSCGICVGSDQLVHVCDNKNKCVSVFKTSGEFVTSFGQFSDPAGIVIDDDVFEYVSNHELAGKVKGIL